MKLNFFFDIDGTLLPFGKDVPESAIRAIESARASGDRIFLATGRSTAEISKKLDVVPIDGGVYSAGAAVYADGKLLYKRVFTEEEKSDAYKTINEFSLDVFIQTDNGTYFTKESYDFFKASMLEYVGAVIDIPNCIVVDKLPLDIEINKLLIMSRDRRIADVREAFKGKFTVVDNTVGLPQDLMAEVVLPDVTKATGIEKILEYYGEKKESVVAIGDGANDIEMVEYAALGIAMGNSSASLKAVADYITDDIERDGLEKAIWQAKKTKS